MSTPTPDFVVRNASVPSRDGTVDVALAAGRIAAVEPALDRTAPAEVDAAGRLTVAGLVDAHVHIDQAFAAEGEPTPRYNDGPFVKAERIADAADYFRRTPAATLTENAVRAAELAAANGVTRLRTHAYVDGTVGTKAVEAVLAARERVGDLLDVEVVAFPQRGLLADPGSRDAAAEALAAGAAVLGGLDPASVNEDVDATIEAWFDLAAAHDVPIDAHVHDRGEPGLETLDRLLEATIDRGYEGRVAVSHAFALADADDPAALAERFARAGVGVVTCYLSTPPGMPIAAFREAGVPVAMGTDQVRDMWSPHGNADPLQGALVESLRLSGPYTRNDGLAALWELLTTGAATLLDAPADGIVPGAPADLVVFDAPSPQWAITTQPRVVHGIKDGVRVVEDGEVLETGR